jgi:hypothetical protein
MQEAGLAPEYLIPIPKEEEKIDGLYQPTTTCITKQGAGHTPEHPNSQSNKGWKKGRMV